jgi:hypothetical protein
MSRALALGLLAACGPRGGGPAALPAGVTLSALPGGHAHGLSDLVVLPDGQAWAVAERPAALQRLALAGAPPAPQPVRGLPVGVEPEALAPAADGGWWLGTEGEGEREDDLIARVRDEDGALTVDLDASLRLSWSQFGLRAPDNKGVEGLCAHQGALIAVGEPVDSGPGGRRAPLARWQDGAWSTGWVPLQTSAGKLSAVACDPDGGLWLIERHYADLALLRVDPGFTLAPAGAPPAALTARRCGPDPAWAHATADGQINWEGLAIDGDRLRWLSDNQQSAVTGPSMSGLTDRRCD